MAKFVYTEFLGDYHRLRFLYEEETLSLDGGEPKTAKTVTYTDSNGGEHIVFKGTGFTYDEGVSGGSVHKIVFQNSDGSAMVTMTDGDFKARQLVNTLGSTDGVELFLDKIYAGNDTLTGSALADFLGGGMGNDHIIAGKGSDLVDGGRGNDRMTGGAGVDFFFFSEFYDKDVVTDFDANGGEGKQDFIAAERKDCDIIKSGHDIILDFGHGDTLTLLDVNRADITNADFHIPE